MVPLSGSQLVFLSGGSSTLFTRVRTERAAVDLEVLCFLGGSVFVTGVTVDRTGTRLI